MRLTNATPSPLDTQRSLDVARGKLEKRQKAPAEDVRPAQAPAPETAATAIPVARTSPAISKTEQALQSQLIDSQRVSQIAPSANARESRPSVADEATPAPNRDNTPSETDGNKPQAANNPAPKASPARTAANPQAGTEGRQSPPPVSSTATPAAKNDVRSQAPAPDSNTEARNTASAKTTAQEPATRAGLATDSATRQTQTSNNRQQATANRQAPAVEREYQEALRTPDSPIQRPAPAAETPATRTRAQAELPSNGIETDTQATANNPRAEQSPATASTITRPANIGQASPNRERPQNQENNKTPETVVPVEARAPINASLQAITQYQASQSLLQDATSTIRIRTSA